MCSAHKKKQIIEEDGEKKSKIMKCGARKTALQKKIPVYYLYYVAEIKKKCIIINKLYFVL